MADRADVHWRRLRCNDAIIRLPYSKAAGRPGRFEMFCCHLERQVCFCLNVAKSVRLLLPIPPRILRAVFLDQLSGVVSICEVPVLHWNRSSACAGAESKASEVAGRSSQAAAGLRLAPRSAQQATAVGQNSLAFVPGGGASAGSSTRLPSKQRRWKATRDASVLEFEIDGIAMRVGRAPTPTQLRSQRNQGPSS